MAYLLRGALIEYGSGLIGPIPNVVIFQFNPESLTRTLNVPPRPGGANARETTQAGERPYESVSFKAHFSAADALDQDKIIARTFGVGPQLAALEKMVHVPAKGGGVLGEALDIIGDALGVGGGGASDPAQPVPRDAFPRLLFIWGLTRVVPVVIDSMQIAEVEYDHLLNPIRAEVDLGFTINALDACSDDTLAKGALAYTTLAKDTQALANLATTAGQVVDLIPL